MAENCSSGMEVGEDYSVSTVWKHPTQTSPIPDPDAHKPAPLSTEVHDGSTSSDSSQEGSGSSVGDEDTSDDSQGNTSSSDDQGNRQPPAMLSRKRPAQTTKRPISKYQEVRAMLSSMEDKERRKNNKIQELKSINQTLVTQNQTLNAKITSLENQIKNLTERVHTLEEELRISHRNLKSKDEKISEKDELIRDLEAKMEFARVDISELIEQNINLNNSITKLQKETANQMATLEETANQMATLEAEKGRLKIALVVAESKIHKYKKMLGENHEGPSLTPGVAPNPEENYNNLMQRFTLLTKEYEDLKTRYDKLARTRPRPMTMSVKTEEVVKASSLIKRQGMTGSFADASAHAGQLPPVHHRRYSVNTLTLDIPTDKSHTTPKNNPSKE